MTNEAVPEYFGWIDSPEDELFADRLFQHVMSGSPSWTPLLADVRVDRVWTALTIMKRDFEALLAAKEIDKIEFQNTCYKRGHFGKADWFEYEVQFRRDRAETVRSKTAVDSGLARLKPAVRALRHKENDNSSRDDVKQRAAAGSDAQLFRNLAEGLARAIAEHKDAIDWSGNEATNSDRALWVSLARLKVPTRTGELSVREWIARMDAPVRN